MTPSQRLKELIVQSKIGYAELGEKTGIAKSSIQRYASGFTKKIPIEAVELLSPILNVSPAYIMCWTDDPSPNKLISDPEWKPVINAKDEKDIEKELESMLAGDAVIAAYGGKLPDEMNEEELEDYELYVSALRTILIQTKKINKKVHTPLKYRTIEKK